MTKSSFCQIFDHRQRVNLNNLYTKNQGKKKGKRNNQNLAEGQIFLFKCNVLLFSMRRLLNCMALFTLVSIFEWSFSWSLDCQATKKAINISRGHGSWPFSTSIASIQKLLKYRTVAAPCVLYCPWILISSLEYMYCHTTALIFR